MQNSVFYHDKAFIRKLPEGFVFVFASNSRGVHGKSSAKDAHTFFGAKYGQPYGLQGRSFAIPTRIYHFRKENNRMFEDIPLKQIKQNVQLFFQDAAKHPNLTFVLTRIGCGNAGYTDDKIAPMFQKPLSNMVLPQEWLPFIEHDEAILVSF